jgi:hypothetical protein
MVYVLVDISDFFRRISSFEEEVKHIYDQLEENETDSRQSKVSEIERLSSSLTSHVREKIEALNSEEKNLKNQIIRLTVVLLQAEEILSKTSNQISKYGESTVKETRKIYETTRDTIHEVNLAILKIRDSAEEILSNYSSTLHELTEL